MTKTKKNFKMYQRFAYKNVIGDLISEILRMERPQNDDELFRAGLNTAIDKVIDLLEEQK